MEPAKTPRERAKDLISWLVPDRRPSPQQGLWAIRIVLAIVVVLGILTLVGQPFGITLWDWLKLLVVPAVIAGGGLWFNAQQRSREQQIADQRAQDEALQAYLDQMSQLLTDKDRPLHRAQRGDPLSTVAVARTLTVLGRVRDLQVPVQPKDGAIYGRIGPFRKRAVVEFLYGGALIQKDQPVISLQRADLSLAYLNSATLVAAGLRDTVLGGADLSEARLADADLRRANLIGADLRYADLSGADLRGTWLIGAYLLSANFSNADLRGAKLKDAKSDVYDELAEAKSLEGATMPDGQVLKSDFLPYGPTLEEWLKNKFPEE